MKNEKLPLANYEKLKVFLGIFFDWYEAQPNLPPEVHPLYVAAEIEKQSFANAKKGLQMAINDIIEDTSRWRPDRVAEADARFAAAGTFTLTEVRRRYSKKYLQILKRGTIRSETEYYLVKGIVDGGSIVDGARIESYSSETSQLQSMLLDYESRIVFSLPSQNPPVVP